MSTSRGGWSIAAALSAHADKFGADFLAVGCYGRSCLRETLLGGATTHLRCAKTPPVVMAH